MTSYCESAPGHPLHGPYHDREYGFPAREEPVLFERMVLEINQAGLSWELMLKKRAAFRAAFDNRRKIDAVIENARRIRALRESHGGFADWLDAHHPLDKAEWVKLLRQTFVFMGPEVVGEFLMSLGYLPGAHRPDCPVNAEILQLGPPWR